MRSWSDHCVHNLKDRMNHIFWKIAGLRPAIFSGTPGNFNFRFLKGVIILDRLVEQTPIEWENVSPHLTPEGNCILVRTKLVLGELFSSLHLSRQLSCQKVKNSPATSFVLPGIHSFRGKNRGIYMTTLDYWINVPARLLIFGCFSSRHGPYSIEYIYQFLKNHNFCIEKGIVCYKKCCFFSIKG